MGQEEKMKFLFDTLCETQEEVRQMIEWIDKDGVDQVYHKMHDLLRFEEEG